MKKIIHASAIEAELKAPASKSYIIRALFASYLYDIKTIITNPNYCDDVRSTIAVLESLGAKYINDHNQISYTGKINVVPENINCGESGLCFRMMSAISAVLELKSTISGSGTLLKRDMSDVEKSLKTLKLYKDKTDKISINSNRSSQFLSGLLLALPLLNEGTIIEVENATSLPYIDLTIEIMKEFGYEIANDNYREFFLKSRTDVDYIILDAEGDWSSASYLLGAGAIAGSLKLKGIIYNSKQADIAILEVLKQVGANLEIESDSITVTKNELNSFEYDATNSPDLIPALVALAVNCKGQSMIKGIHRLINKESNRLESLYYEYRKLNCKIEIFEDSFIIEKSNILGGLVNSYNDHRIAMSLAIAALNANSAITIEDAECVSKSYPNFFEDLKLIGVNINE